MLKSAGNVILFSIYSKNKLAMTRSKHTPMKHIGEPTNVCRINPIHVASSGTPLPFNDNWLWTSKSNHIRFFRMLLVIHADPVYVIIRNIKLMPPLSVRWFRHESYYNYKLLKSCILETMNAVKFITVNIWFCSFVIWNRLQFHWHKLLLHTLWLPATIHVLNYIWYIGCPGAQICDIVALAMNEDVYISCDITASIPEVMTVCTMPQRTYCPRIWSAHRNKAHAVFNIRGDSRISYAKLEKMFLVPWHCIFFNY